MRLRYSQKAVEALARELRRASWGAALVFSSAGIKMDLGLGYVLGAASWLALQFAAFLLDSITGDDDND